MRIGIVAVDSRGGVQPYAAWGLALQAARHAVRLIVPQDAAAGVAALGLPTASLSADLREGARLAASAGGIRPGGVVPRGVRQRMIEQSLVQAAELREAARGLEVLTGAWGEGCWAATWPSRCRFRSSTATSTPSGRPRASFPGCWPPDSWAGWARSAHAAAKR